MSYDYTRTGYVNVYWQLSNSNKTSGSASYQLSLNDSKSGSNVPSYRAKIRKQLSASSSYSRDITSFRVLSPPFGSGVSSPGTAYELSSFVAGSAIARPSGLMPSMTITAEMQNRALEKLHGKILDEYNRVQSLPFALEFAKTKESAGKLTGDLVDSTIGFKRKIQSLYFRYRSVKKGWARFMADSSSRFLEWKFGIAPTMHDISSALEELSGSALSDPPTIRATFRTDSRQSGKQIQDYSAVHTARLRDVIIVGSCTYYLRLSPRVNVMCNWGLNAGAIPGAVWEVTPWSWLVDYFYNIGTYLNQWQYISMPIIYGGISKRSRAVEITTVCPEPHGNNNITDVNGATSRIRTVYSRTPFTTIPVFVPTLNLAGPFQGSREWNLAALIGTRFKRF